jgi:hypothetical protein
MGHPNFSSVQGGITTLFISVDGYAKHRDGIVPPIMRGKGADPGLFLKKT